MDQSLDPSKMKHFHLLFLLKTSTETGLELLENGFDHYRGLTPRRKMKGSGMRSRTSRTQLGVCTA